MFDPNILAFSTEEHRKIIDEMPPEVRDVVYQIAEDATKYFEDAGMLGVLAFPLLMFEMMKKFNDTELLKGELGNV